MSVEPRTPGAAGGEDRRNHVCWVYADAAEFRAHAAAFLREGLAAGQRLEYFGSASVEELRRELADVPEFRELLARDAVTLQPLEDWYLGARAGDPPGQVAAYAAATRAAVADGYTGLRVAVEATDLVATGPEREVFARYEHLVDRYMADEPLYALCGYDRRTVGAEAAAELACLHPRTSPAASSFRWWVTDEADVGLSGVVDTACRSLFDLTLSRTLPLLPAPRVVVDARDLEFVNHPGLLSLERRAQETNRHIVLRTEARTVRRLVDLLQLQAVEIAA